MLNPGTLLQNRYHICRQIGGGGMGTVYLAEDNRLSGRRCAIKEMSPADLAPNDCNWSIQAFRQEAQMLANLDHPGLTRVTDFFPEVGNWYLVMDYVEGETLEARLMRTPQGRLPINRALHITRQLCDVLTYLHNCSPQVIFRDLKPGNIMLTLRDEVKLIDFGIARFFKPGKTHDTVHLGTPGYAAPEQYGGLGQSDPRTDVYSLGALLHHMVTGHDPTTAASPFPLPDPRSVMPSIPPSIADVVGRATQMRPALRYATIQEMQQALFPPTYQLPSQPRSQPFSPKGPTPSPNQSGSNTGPTVGSGRGLWIGLAIAVVIVVLCAGGTIGAIAMGMIPGRDTETATTRTAESPPSSPSPSPSATSPANEDDQETETPIPITKAPTETAPPPSPRPLEVVSDTPLQIVYVRGSVGSTDIYVANAEGENRRCIACRECDEAEPAWSSDGQSVLYQADCDRSYDIWKISSQGGTPRQLTDTSGTDEREPAMSPDGNRIVYRTQPEGTGRNEDGEIHIMNAGGGGNRSLGIRGRSPEWSPDGNRLVYMSERDGGWEIYVYTFSDESVIKLTDCSANCRWPAWSPDGNSVIYHSTTGAGSVTADTLWITNIFDRSNTRFISGYHPGRPTWSREGYIAFNSDRGIEMVTTDGKQRQTLIADEMNWAPIWSP